MYSHELNGRFFECGLSFVLGKYVSSLYNKMSFTSFGFLFLALLCGNLAGCCINIHRLICISSRDIFLIRLKSKIKDLESENELLLAQRVVVEHVANSGQADSALKQIENRCQVHEDVKTEEVQQVTKVEQQIIKITDRGSRQVVETYEKKKEESSTKDI
ncbi:PREDICTED: uncharacterized protein LOC109173423 [Ipomoea nil]|uniref:uncharacterized protein LOC109173423 n=1 Tax=Ipomoea nil TaxID=35883 RepID=UPI0009017493|nr:PREDICTED: uncharacterized protein LOC109173423 [Ipomoea nil]